MTDFRPCNNGLDKHIHANINIDDLGRRCARSQEGGLNRSFRKLKPSDVPTIIAEYNAGKSTSALGKQYRHHRQENGRLDALESGHTTRCRSCSHKTLVEQLSPRIKRNRNIDLTLDEQKTLRQQNHKVVQRRKSSVDMWAK